jgi:RNA repair pathway DNA polymerase beta family protein
MAPTTTDQTSPKIPTRLLNLPDAFLAAMWYRGSQAHGTYIPPEEKSGIDDIDLMGVVIPPIDTYMGLKNWGSRGTKEVKDGPWDVVYYEFRKFVGLLLKGNPNVMMSLWMPDKHMVRDNSFAWHALLRDKAAFVARHVYAPFVGYATAQLEKMTSIDRRVLAHYMSIDNELKRRGAHTNPEPADEALILPDDRTATTQHLQGWRVEYNRRLGGNLGYLGDKRKKLILQNGYDTKNAAHLLRLLAMGVEFLQTGEMIPDRRDSHNLVNADFLIKVKKGEFALQTIQEMAELLFAKAKEAHDGSKLPAEPDFERANRMVTNVLKWEFM